VGKARLAEIQELMDKTSGSEGPIATRREKRPAEAIGTSKSSAAAGSKR